MIPEYLNENKSILNLDDEVSKSIKSIYDFAIKQLYA